MPVSVMTEAEMKGMGENRATLVAAAAPLFGLESRRENVEMGEGTGDQITQYEFRLVQSQFQPVCPFDVKEFLCFCSLFVLLSPLLS